MATTTPVHIRSGKLELSAKGTILLDEITEMPIGVQANLMRVLQNKRFMRPGTSAAVEVDIRVLAASTTNIEHAVSEKRFREDLYYLLSAYTIHVPPLRERKEELGLLSRHFMHKLAKPIWPLSARFFAGDDRGLPGLFLARQPAGTGSFVKRYLMTGDKEQAFGKDQTDPRSGNGASIRRGL